jgi:antirestriction protein
LFYFSWTLAAWQEFMRRGGFLFKGFAALGQLKPSEKLMSIQLHAQPYDLTAGGFYFTTADEYATKANTNRNDYGEQVEEYEIQFIDGDLLDCELAKAWGIHQGSFADYLDKAEEWDEAQKANYIIAVGECGYDHAQIASNPDDADIDIYHVSTMRELAEQFVDEGLFGDIPEHLVHYIDYDAIARDLAIDYTETEISGMSLIYRCA